MKVFTDEQALELGRDILQRFEDGLNGKKWCGRSVVLPFMLTMGKGAEFIWPVDELSGLGNAWVPQVGREAFMRLSGLSFIEEDYES
jgi:hypothetical protein